MITATQPTSHIAVPTAWESKIAARWEEWRGNVTVWLALPLYARPVAFVVAVEAIKTVHRTWALSLLARRIPMKQIRRLALDDPRELRLTLESRVASYLASRRVARSDLGRQRTLQEARGREREREMTGNAYHDANCVHIFGKGLKAVHSTRTRTRNPKEATP